MAALLLSTQSASSACMHRTTAPVRPVCPLINTFRQGCSSATHQVHGARQSTRTEVATPATAFRPTAADNISLQFHPSFESAPTTAPQHARSPAHSFNYNKSWWPVIPVDYLDTDRPTPATLLGINLVLWRQPLLATDPNGPGIWRAFKDECPHRLAPLSEGRVENGQLQCSYHGWRFGGDGRCNTIPQSIDAQAEATACASSRSCAKAFPTQERAGLLWVWPDESPSAAAEAAAVLPPVTVGADRHYPTISAERKSGMWTMREVAYSYEVLLENLSDPAHLPFSHHGVGMLNRTNGKPMPFNLQTAQQRQQVEEKLPAKLRYIDMLVNIPDAMGSSSGGSSDNNVSNGSSSGDHSNGSSSTALRPASADPGVNGEIPSFAFTGNIAPEARTTFHAPALVTYAYTLGATVRMQVDTYAVPTGPGRSRAFVATMPTRADAPEGAPKPNLLQSMGGVLQMLVNSQKRAQLLRTLAFKAQPVWKGHMMTNTILDGDSVFLVGQQQNLAKHGNKWREAYYLPGQCDRLMSHIRKWIEEVAGGPPFGDQELPVKPLDHRTLLDRYSQHTVHCKICKTALAGIERAIATTRIVAAVLFVAFCAATGLTSPLVGAAIAAQAAKDTAATVGLKGLAAPVIDAAAPKLWQVLAPVTGLAVTIGLCVWLIRRWEAMIPQFHFVDYVHAEHN